MSYTCSCNEQTNYISLSVLTYLTVVQEKNYIAELTSKLHKNEEIITTLQKQLEQSNQQSKYTCAHVCT